MKKKTQGVKKDMVRAEVRNLVHGPSYMTFEDAVADFPMKHINTRPPNIAYSPWHLLEHMRPAQRDILDYIRNPDYRAPKCPRLRPRWRRKPTEGCKRRWPRFRRARRPEKVAATPHQPGCADPYARRQLSPRAAIASEQTRFPSRVAILRRHATGPARR